MQKALLGLCLLFLADLAWSQGLESVIVEKYYISNAADSTGSVGLLPAGSTTYRIYADMLPGYKFQALYGSQDASQNPPLPLHELSIATTTAFFNNVDRGDVTPNAINVTYTKKNSVMIDSWFSVGATATGKMGVLKTEDTDGSIGNSSVPPILQNTVTAAGIPIKTEDGMISGSPQGVTFVGLTTELNVFNATSQLGNLFSTTNGSVASLNGSVGPTAANKVLIGQFTTTGIFSFELNIQVGTPAGGVENYVARNPASGEIQMASLMLNAAPTVSITSPLNGGSFFAGTTTTITASAADMDYGSVSSVEFFVSGVSLGIDHSVPYTANWTAVIGSSTLTAVATDNKGAMTTSSPSIVHGILFNVAPAVNITYPGSGASFTTGDTIAITASAGDIDGLISSVKFYAKTTLLGTDNTSPFVYKWKSTVGTTTLTAVATDNLGAQTTSAKVKITVINNVPPTVDIITPSNLASFITGAVVPIKANASDADGAVDSVEFFVSDVKVGVDTAAPYQVNWTSTVGSHIIKAVAIDNKGGQKVSSPKTIIVKNNIAPTVRITNPASGTLKTGPAILTIFATSSDADGIIQSVEFFVNNIKVGSCYAPTYQTNWLSTVGVDTLTAIATDNLGVKTVSAEVIINVKGAVDVNELDSSGNSVEIYPNPAGDMVTMEINTSGQHAINTCSYSIYGIEGNLISRKELGILPVKYFENIDISVLPKGQYIIELAIGDFISKKEIIKN